jgi:hypothetical protein
MSKIAIITVEVVDEKDALKVKRERLLSDDSWRTVANLGLEHFGVIGQALDNQAKPEKAILVVKQPT